MITNLTTVPLIFTFHTEFHVGFCVITVEAGAKTTKKNKQSRGRKPNELKIIISWTLGRSWDEKRQIFKL